MGSARMISRKSLPAPPPVATISPPAPGALLLSLLPCSRSCWMSFSDSERPVPSYPFTVEQRKTR